MTEDEARIFDALKEKRQRERDEALGARPGERLMVWWLSNQGAYDAAVAPAGPRYIKEQLASLRGRNGRGRLWVDESFGPLYLPRLEGEKGDGRPGGIVIRASDARFCKGGRITEEDLRVPPPARAEAWKGRPYVRLEEHPVETSARAALGPERVPMPRRSEEPAESGSFWMNVRKEAPRTIDGPGDHGPLWRELTEVLSGHVMREAHVEGEPLGAQDIIALARAVHERLEGLTVGDLLQGSLKEQTPPDKGTD